MTQDPIAWMVTNVDGQDAYVTTDPTLAGEAQRALPLYTAPVMDTCADIRSSSTQSGGGFIERELAVARGFASCRGDDERLDQADQELAAMRAEAERLRAEVERAVMAERESIARWIDALGLRWLASEVRARTKP